ncbi:MAG TPA: Wzz/FepE/Etk N-terminal domain-containing protein [Thermoflexales bacterium]|nr:Wzz/FepE/Etk N-terminal domain-containing protein [Thermoflexales bacterium]
MQFQDYAQNYLQIARRRWWIVLLTALVAGMAAFGFSKLQTPVYKSTMLLYVTPARADLGLSQSAKSLVASYRGIVFTKKNADVIRERQNLDYAPEYIYGQTKTADDGYQVTIEVKDYNGETANRIAREWAQLFVEYRNTDNAKQRREDRVDATLGDDPIYSQDSPRTTVNTAAGLVLGALVGAIIVAVLEWAQASVLRTHTDVERALALPIMGEIPADK